MTDEDIICFNQYIFNFYKKSKFLQKIKTTKEL